MEMTMNLPRNYVEIEEEEMMYLEGSARRYSGTRGWAVAGVLAAAGYGMMAFGRYIKKAVGPFIKAVLSGGPIAWIGVGLSALGVAAIYYAGSCFAGAAGAASWAMLTKGYFTIGYKWNTYSPIYVS